MEKLTILSSFLLLMILVIYGCTGSIENVKLLNRHNELRAAVHPTASNMLALHWNDCLASVASDYLDSCPGTRHNPDRPNRRLQRAVSLVLLHLCPKTYIWDMVMPSKLLMLGMVNIYFNYEQNSCENEEFNKT